MHEAPFQCSFDFSVAESLGRAFFDVSLCRLIKSHACFCDDVKGFVEESIAVPVESVSDGVARGCLERRYACQRGEGGCRMNPARV